MTPRSLVRSAVSLGAVMLVVAGPSLAGADDEESYVGRLESEVALLLGVAAAAPAPLRLELLAAFQQRILGDTDRFTTWDDVTKSRIRQQYERVWQSFRSGDDSEGPAKGVVTRHAEIRQALGGIGGPDVMRTIVERLRKGEPIGAVLAAGVKQLEGIDYHAASAASGTPPEARLVHAAAARWVADWSPDREMQQARADLDLLGRFAARVPPPDAALGEALVGLAERISQACLQDDPAGLDAYRSFNARIDAIRASGIVRSPGGVDAHLKTRFRFVVPRVGREGLVMDLERPDLAGPRGDVVEVRGAVLGAVQYFDRDGGWIEPEIPVRPADASAPVYYVLPNRTLRLRYRLETEPAALGVAESVWLVQPERTGPNTPVEVLLPRAAVRGFFYHRTLQQDAYWVSRGCWNQADALEAVKAHLQQLGEERRAKVRQAFFVLWRSAGGAPPDLDDAGLKNLFAKVEYDRSFEARPFCVDASSSLEVERALIELFGVESNLLAIPARRGEQLPGWQLARELLRLENIQEAGLVGLVNASGQKTMDSAALPAGAVGICTVIPMVRKGTER
ncbi:MAG: hypothetical protein JXQ29_08745 [Planctomycetes bacterium]|nr:hypothetical protein [Planctomycetota bacterium]